MAVGTTAAPLSFSWRNLVFRSAQSEFEIKQANCFAGLCLHVDPQAFTGEFGGWVNRVEAILRDTKDIGDLFLKGAPLACFAMFHTPACWHLDLLVHPPEET